MTTTLYSEKAASMKRPLLGLSIAQFVGAFNDNAWKLIIFTLATSSLHSGGLEGAAFEYSSQMVATLALMVFLVPFLIFSFPAGAIADRYSKRSVIIWMKALEFSIMALATLSLLFFPDKLFFPYLLLAMMGLQSAIFGPSKYGILPQILPYQRLSYGNGIIESWSMIAIITGTGLGPLLLAFDGGGEGSTNSYIAPLILTLLSLFSLAASFTIPNVEPARRRPKGVIKSLSDAYIAIAADRILLLATIGNVLFWTITSLLGQNVLVYAKSLVVEIERGELYQGLLPASYGAGIAIGALLGGRLSGKRIEYGLIPFGSIGFSIMSLLLGAIQPEILGTVAILVPMGISTGLLIVPLKAIVQWRSPKEERGAVIALGNIFDIVGMIAGSLLAALMAWMSVDLGTMLMISAVVVVVSTIFSVKLLPEALTRLFFVMLTTKFYKIRIVGEEHLPDKGPALLVANHLSATDAFFVMASVDRPIRFVMSERHYNKWWLRPFALAMNAIPVHYSGKNAVIKQSLQAAGKPLESGELVCIFPEGQVSRTGNLQPFREGVEEIVKGRDCPIIPVNLDRVFGTLFSPIGGRYIPRRPQNIPHPLTVTFGSPLPSNTPFSQIRREIRKLGCNAWFLRREDEPPIHYHFIRSVWRAPWKHCLGDRETKRVSRFKTLSSSIALARLLRYKWDGEERVGIMLPPSIAAVITNIAASLGGRCVVNFNYSVGKEDLAYCIAKAEVKQIVTSRQFLKKVAIEFPEEVELIYLEDCKPHITTFNKLSSALLSLIGPVWLIETLSAAVKKPSVDDLLALVFTSGSTARPKGVMLTHFNVSSNVEAVSQIVPAICNKDKLLHTLPLFHSFGYMTMWLGLNHGLPLIFYPNPLDGAAIGKIVQEQKITMIWTTPTFLKAYIPQVSADMFGSLRLVLTGAEKMPKKLAALFRRKYGVEPIEGYGTTECSPVIAASTLDVRLPGVYQAGSLEGSVGQPLPGVRLKIVDPQSFEELPYNEAGLLLVKGPNVMKGYLGDEMKTKEVIKEGWYVTGDIATLDESDFLTITDRISRFSKIGGEMVPHGKIEEALHSIEESDDPSFAVTAIPDEKKGESLAVLHTLEEGKVHSVLQKLMDKNLPKLYIPRFDHFVKVEKIPYTATGKIDLREVKRMANELLCTNESLPGKGNKAD